MIILRDDTERWLPIWIPFVAFTTAWFLLKLYHAFLGPLSKYPGPLVCKFTILPYITTSYKGNEVAFIGKLHDKYGPIVRFAPDRLSFMGSADAWRDIYGFAKSDGTKCPKDAMFYGRTINGAPSLLMSSDADHSRQRKIISHAFSDRALKEQEPLLHRWATLLREKLTEHSAKGPVDMLKMLNCTTFDVMADLTFAEPLYMLENSSYVPWVTNSFKGLKQNVKIRSFRLQSDLMNWLVNFLLPKFPGLRDKQMINWKYTSDRVDKRLSMTPDRPDLFTRILEKVHGPNGLSKGELYTNAVGFMLAG